jgi:hypothetical protein
MIAITVVLAVGVAALAAVLVRERLRGATAVTGPRARRILFPFTAEALSARALEAALRLAVAEEATLVPAFLAQVPMYLPLDASLPRQSALCLPLQEVIEQRAAEAGVPVDARVARGRTYRHALAEAIAHERFDRIVVAAAAEGEPGFDADDVAWLLKRAPGEIVVLRTDGHGLSRECETAGSR